MTGMLEVDGHVGYDKGEPGRGPAEEAACGEDAPEAQPNGYDGHWRPEDRPEAQPNGYENGHHGQPEDAPEAQPNVHEDGQHEQPEDPVVAVLWRIKTDFASEELQAKLKELREQRRPRSFDDVGEEIVRVFSDHIGLLGYSRGAEEVSRCMGSLHGERQRPEVDWLAREIERLAGMPPGTMFLIHTDAQEPPSGPEGPPGLTLQGARDLVWRLVARCDCNEFQFGLRVSEMLWSSHSKEATYEYCKVLHVYHHCYRDMLAAGFWSPEQSKVGATIQARETLKAHLAAYHADAELNGLAWRLDELWAAPPGSFHGLRPEDTGGSKYPHFKAEDYVKRVGVWHSHHCDKAYHEEGQAFVVPPEVAPQGPAPALLFLLGHGHFNSRERFLEGDVRNIFQHEAIRRHFYVVVPKPSCRTGTAYYHGVRFERDWNEDAVWALFTEILRRLGPEKVDPGRLYVTGCSQGGAGTWHMCLRYGRYFAAAIAWGGAPEWPHNTWPKGSDPDPEALRNLRMVPLRAVHVDIDNHAPPPKKDMEYLAYGLEERWCNFQALGFNMKKRFNILQRKWLWEDKGPGFMELWWVEGPLDDEYIIKGFWKEDKHLVWIRAMVNWYWGFSSFLLEHRCPEERQWRFEDPPLRPDSSQHKAKLDKAGYYEPKEKDLYAVRSKADIERLVAEFRKQVAEAFEGAGGAEEVCVDYFRLSRQAKSKLEFNVIADRPWDTSVRAFMKPGLPVWVLKIRAAAGIFKDAKKFNTFGIGLRPVPQPGGAYVVKPLPIYEELHEGHAECDVSEEVGEVMSAKAGEVLVIVLLFHDTAHEQDGYWPRVFNVKKGTRVGDLRKLLKPEDVEELERPFAFAPASQSAKGDENEVPGIFPLEDSVVLGEEHLLLQVCKPGIKMELILDPASGAKRDYSVEEGTTIGELRYMLSDANPAKQARMAVGLPPKKKDAPNEPLADDVVIKKAHAKLNLWTVIIPKAKPAPKQ